MNKNIVYLKALTALTGKLVYCSDNEEAKQIIQAMKELGDYDYDPDTVIKKAFQYCTDGTIKYLIVNTVNGDIHISMIIGTKEYPVPEDLETDEGVFAYVYNVSCDIDSELGYIFLKKSESGSYRRIG